MSVNNNAINAPFPLTVPQGGSGLATLTSHSVQVGAGTSAVTQLTVGSNGQVLIGASAANPAFATLTSSGGTITYTTGANSLNLEVTTPATGASLTWSVITGSTQAVAVNNGYIANYSGTCVLTLPAVAAVGTLVGVSGMNTAAGWQLAQGAGQQVFFGTSSSTLGATGYLESTNIYDTVTLVCNVANTDWIVISSIGNPTVH
ncbi:hypothetical protein UFOVP97_36 [uncultured Caudovirales phage]|uniref:Uncharacterized protein n=1 Tax=uncultured Caudovirales phage TaxID=2100421 RepID=A0A6J5L790_9CAUD|nr:hypothetical protein UFOVP97_36 [uncultured Caudovirales phage]CAB4134405.1 hypothetical protein UFOVP268_54 [uncultured Caudovirales phage]